MAKRATKAEGMLIAAAIVIGLPIYGAVMLFESLGGVLTTLLVVSMIGFIVWFQYDKKQKRLAYLREKYQDEEIVQSIMKGYFWQGQSAEQLVDSLGPPSEVDHKLLKTKSREVWKYQQRGANRFGLRITIENGFVSGWDKKA